MEPVVHSVDADKLEFGGGLETLLDAALESVAPGRLLEVRTPSRGVALELPGWARLSGHEVVEERHSFDIWEVIIRRGASRRVLAGPLPPRSESPRLRGGEFHTGDWRAATPAEIADPGAGFAPLGSVVEECATPYHWALGTRDALWADDVAELAEQASAQQWDASAEVPWSEAVGLPGEIERAVAQVMTFIAQNEYAALYIPARFLPNVNPQYPELLLWLSSHVHDEARHIEVFTKRALAGGYVGYAMASTELSLRTLMEEQNFTSSSFLLNVLGEGTFLDLLRFIELNAPDAATAAACKLAHRDERRHVHFGISHVRRVVEQDQSAKGELMAAAQARAAKLSSLSGISPMLLEALTILAAGSMGRTAIGSAASRVNEMTQLMERNRIRRLVACGFDDETARELSDMHTPNLM